MNARPFARSGAVLCFHSVTTPDLPSLSNTHLTLAELGRIIRAIRLVARIVPLSELVERHRSGRSTAGLVAVTFDDAYRALLDCAESLFVRQHLPATVFVTTAYSRSSGRFWWDRLEEVLALAPAARWQEFERACGVPEAFRAGQRPDDGPFRPMRQWLLAEHRGRWPVHLEPLLLELEREVASHSSHRPMSFEELDRFASLPGIDIGVHSETHAVLPFLTPPEFVREVGGCYAELRERYPSARPFLAIPFGLFDRDTGPLAREAGMEAGLTLTGSTFRRIPPDSVLLPRICAMHGMPQWRFLAHAFGLWELIRPRMNAYPELPSATT